MSFQFDWVCTMYQFEVICNRIEMVYGKDFDFFFKVIKTILLFKFKNSLLHRPLFIKFSLLTTKTPYP